MRLSFQFEDFFGDRRTGAVDEVDAKTPAFVVQSGVVGDLKIKDLNEALLNDAHTSLEVDLEGKKKDG